MLKNKAQNSAPKQKSKTQYRDNILRKLCQDKSRAIELCNAITGSNYQADAKVKLHELENSLVWRYNDTAIEVEDELLVMIEHSTTVSPNIPLRLLSYVTDILYTWIVITDELYSSKILKIPTPKFYLLYNGTEVLKEKTLKLSAAFETDGGENSIELVVNVIDINYLSGDVVLNNSESLKGYAYLIEQIRIYMNRGLPRDKAIQAAINHCIETNVLAEFLTINYKEVADMLNLQYDQDAEFRAIRKDAKEEGREEEREKRNLEIVKNGLDNNIPIETISVMTGLSIEEINKMQQEM